jgi:hypothetical protein
VNDENPFEGGKELVHLIFIIPTKKKTKLRSDSKAHHFNYLSFERTILLHNNSNTSQQKEKQ